MEKRDFEKYLSTPLTVEIGEFPENYASGGSSMSTFYPLSSLLDLNWNDGDDDVFMLEIFKKAFGAEEYRKLEKSMERLSLEITKLCNEETEYSREICDTSENITEFVTVPSSKHVAQILGKNGSKIRALRNSTNTYIRSPLPTECPVFTVKGKKQDVFEAVNFLISASNYFTSLENEKQIAHNEAILSSQGEVIVVKFSIPINYIGLVVGMKGATIKTIEKQSKTFIQSPIADLESIFVITGSSKNCEKAMSFISRYLCLRGVGPGIIECVNNLEYHFAWICLKP